MHIKKYGAFSMIVTWGKDSWDMRWEIDINIGGKFVGHWHQKCWAVPLSSKSVYAPQRSYLAWLVGEDFKSSHLSAVIGVPEQQMTPVIPGTPVLRGWETREFCQIRRRCREESSSPARSLTCPLTGSWTAADAVGTTVENSTGLSIIALLRNCFD